MAGYSKVAVIGGPTACGKSVIALETAKTLSGEIICSDSMQIYSGVRIGTASPSDEDYAAVPHLLFGSVPPDTGYSLFDYQKDAYNAIEDVLSRGKLPVLCGGTGLYITTLAEGVSLSEANLDRELRARLEAEYDRDPESMQKKLANVDPGAAHFTHINNRKRIVRYLELFYSTGKTYAERAELSHGGGKSREKYDYRIFILEPERTWLRGRIDRRIDQMKDGGLLEEAELVYRHRDSWKTLSQAIGFKELFPYFEGTADMDTCIANLKTATYHYAKRQATWFNRMKDTERIKIDCDASLESATQEIINKLN